MEVFAYYWKTEEITEKYNYHTELRIYGLNKNNENVCVRVDDCKTRLIIEFSDQLYLDENFELIKSKFASLIYNKIDKNSIKKILRRKLYGSHLDNEGKPKLYNFIEIYFTSRISMLSFKKKSKELNLLSDFKFHETGVSTEIQFMVERDLNPSGWLFVKRPTEILGVEKSTRCKEYLVSKNQIFNLDCNDIVDVKILSWDIEAKCKDIARNPGKDIDDCVFQISCVFFNVKSKRLRKILLSLGKCRQFADNVEIQLYKTEKDLILGFSNLISQEQPNILTGWNIFNFDINFMINRAEHNMCLGEFTSFGFVETPGNITNLKWSSKAFMTTDIKYIDAEGVLSIDLIEVVRRDYKLDSYSLNNVSKHFLKNEKDDISFKDLMYAYDCFLKKSENLEDEFTKIGKYCVQDSQLVVDLFDKLQTWLSLSEMSKTTSTTIMSVHLNGQQKKFYNQVFKYCYKENIIVESDAYRSKDTDRYTGAYVFDPVPGLYDYVVPLDFASLYPSIMIAYNLDYTTIISEENNDIPEENVTVMEWEDHISCEHDPLIIQKNALSRLIENSSDKKKISEYRKARANITKKINKKIMCQKNSFKFLKQEIYGKGVLPTIIQRLLDARKEVRNEMKKVKDPSYLAILNQRQLSYKVSANSMYGATGVKSGALPFMPIAMCVTYTGRQSIQKASNILKSLGGTIVYGDTDSNYVMFENIKSENHKEKCIKIWDKATEVAEKISSNFPNPMKIDFEEVIYYKFMILTKKRYMYYSCSRDGEISKKIGQKGVLLARRDNSKFVKNIYEETVMNVFSGKTKEEVYDCIFNKITDLTERRLDYNLLKITKSVNDYNNCDTQYNEETDKYTMGHYKVRKPPVELSEEHMKEFHISNLPAQVQLEIKIIGKGGEKSEGSRIEFVILDKPGSKKQCDKIEHFKFFMENKNILNIDTNYYILRLIDPLEQIFDSIYNTDRFIEKNLSQFMLKKKQTQELKKLFYPKFILK